MLPIKSSKELFDAEVQIQITKFESADFLTLINSGLVTKSHFHSILVTVFHQTYLGPYTFAAAAANCEWKHATAKEYLLKHADEEKEHWKWVINDLQNTDYAGADPRTMFPHHTCEAYISFNERVATRMPVARLAIASVLEGIGAAYGGNYGQRLLNALDLQRHQASFFVSHGHTDLVHSEELDAVISNLKLSDEEWGWMTHAAKMAGTLYRAMYSHESFTK